jgi:hypothetical protein
MEVFLRLAYGNGCGHDPLNPNFTLAKPAKKGKGGLPPILTKCMERIADYYYRPRQVLPSLYFANDSDRGQRSERREACVLLLKALLKHTDLVSLRVGIPTKDGFLNLTVDYISQQTGMELKRSERALGDLKAAGLITISQPCQRLTDGSWKGLAAVKAISKHLFGAIGLNTNTLKRERKKAGKRLKKKAREWEQEEDNDPLATLTSKARMALFMGALSEKLGEKPKFKPAQTSDPPGDPEYRKQLMLTAAKIKQAHMDWDRDRCYEEAEKQLSGFRSIRV